MAVQSTLPPPTLFQVSRPSECPVFGPRLGVFSSRRKDAFEISISTPGLLTATSRGVVPHLSRDHVNGSDAIRWTHVPFETFDSLPRRRPNAFLGSLEHDPPVPTLQTGSHPLHTFLGFDPSRHVVSLSLRDPADGREMPPNGKDTVCAYCIRGVRKVTQSSWRDYFFACQPDMVVALSDTPLTKPPYSQKRLTKSIERSFIWLLDTLRADPTGRSSVPVLVPLAGGASVAARHAFSSSLTEPLSTPEADIVSHLKCMDEGIAGYIFDLVPLRISMASGVVASEEYEPSISLESRNALPVSVKVPTTAELLPLMKASLEDLPPNKLRIVHSALSPHEILRLIHHVGADLFDANWAQRAADIGIALDFAFPVSSYESAAGDVDRRPRVRENGKRDLGHNLFDEAYAHDFAPLAANFLAGVTVHTVETNAETVERPLVCPCAACSPATPERHISHSSADPAWPAEASVQAPYVRAYMHHLLLTHEMSALSLLVLHNLAVLDAFFAGIRSVLSLPDGVSRLETEIDRFVAEYDEGMAVFAAARSYWQEVELARGKGRLAREKAKQVETSRGVSVDL